MKKIILLISISIFSVGAEAQINDAQLWENVNLEKVLSPKVSVRINQEGRLVENWSIPGYNYFDLGANYKYSKHLHVALAYVWVEKRVLDGTWSARHQIYVDATLRKRLGPLMFNDRQMFLWQVKDYFSSADGRIPDYYLRNKVTIRWDKTFKIQPYVAEEIYYRMYGPGDPPIYHFNRIRCFAGCFYHPDRSNELECYYLWEHHFNMVDPTTNWVVGLGYAHTF